MDAAEGDHVRLRFRRLEGKAERIAHEIRQFLDLPVLVIVGQDHGVALFFQLQDFFDQVGSGSEHRRETVPWEQEVVTGKEASSRAVAAA